MSTPVVHRVRLSFIWMETTLEPVRNPVPSKPFAFLGRAATFIPRFDSLQKGQTDPDDLTLPWPKPAGQRFWTYYLGGARPGDVPGGKAWGALVPVRLKLDVSVTASWLPGRAVLEGYFYPHGHALVATFEVAPVSLSLPATVDLARDIRKRRKLMVTGPTGSEELILDAMADSVLGTLRERALGPGAPGGVVATSPFSLVTFVGIDGVDPEAVPEEGGEIHRALEALTGWQLGPLVKPSPLRDSVLKGETTPDVVYARTRGRAVWFPYHALKPDHAPKSGKPTLSCYHRNLVYASLQLESLARLVVETDEHGFLSDTHRDLARYAGGLLGRLYGGSGDKVKTYRSASCRIQLEQNDWLDPTDNVRTMFPPMTKLQRTKPAPAAAASPAG